MFAALLTSLLACQDPTPTPAPPPATPAQQPEPAPKVEAWDDKTAKAAADELTKLMKGTPSMAEKSAALERVASGSNKLLVKPLAQIVERDKSVLIRKRAAELIANQPAADAGDAILRLLKNSRVNAFPAVMAELVRALSGAGYTSANWRDIDNLFEQDYLAERVPLHEAILDLITRHKEKQALPLLLRNLDEPIPSNVQEAKNPPAEYWEARWKAWAVWREKVKEALFAITGQRFSTAAEAKEWLKKNPLK
ncbi:MAG TPA: hypothetical protein VFZ65_21310 [Planctomycetota bacterium]|nr:hypothetical protein [Planctomycetota bacterium]